MSDVAMFDDEMTDAPEDPAAGSFDIIAAITSVNLVPDLDENEVTSIGRRVVDEYQMDVESRKKEGWDAKYKAAMDMALQIKEDKNYPWPGAANIKYPLIATAAIQFNARAYPAIIDGWNVVKGKVIGPSTPEKRERADRIAAHMSYQLIEEMDGWEEDTDRLLLMLPVVGSVMRKTWFDPIKGYNCSSLVPADRFVVNYWTKDLASCPRSTEECDYYPNEIEERFRSGLWTRVDIGETDSEDEFAPHRFLEQHRLLDLDEDGYYEPYVVTVHQETGRVVRIVARFDEDGMEMNGQEVVRITPVLYYTKYGFVPSPDGAFYDIGFGMLLTALNETINSTINQLMDAGHLANVQGGFLGSGISMKSGAVRMKPGEWKRVETTGGALRDSVVPLPVKEPSSVLFNLLGMLIEATKDITATKDILTGEQPANTPVGTTLALIEQGLKVFTAIYKRIHRSLKGEFALLYRLNRLYLQPEAYFEFQDQQGVVAQADYAAKGVDVVPVSDPTVVSDMQRMGRAQFLMQFLGKGLNDQEIIKRVLEAASIPDIKALMPEGPPPPDPKAAQEMMKLTLDKRKLDIDGAVAEAKIAVDEANARKITLETELLAPGTFEQLMAMVRQAVAETMGEDQEPQPEQLDQGEPPEPQEMPDDGPPEVLGMEGEPVDGGVPEIPEGQPDGFDDGMGPGGQFDPGTPMQGGPDGGVIEPGMG